VTAKPPYRGTRLHAIRIPDDLWARAREITAAREDTITGVVNRALERYVSRHGGETAPAKEGDGS
jgi:predicted transcriptional regulator